MNQHSISEHTNPARSAQVEAFAASLKARTVSSAAALAFACENAHDVSRKQMERIRDHERPEDHHLVRLINVMRTNSVRARDGLQPAPSPDRNHYFPTPKHTLLSQQDLDHFLAIANFGVAQAVAELLPRLNHPTENNLSILQEILATTPKPVCSASPTQGKNIIQRYRRRLRTLQSQRQRQRQAGETAGTVRPKRT